MVCDISERHLVKENWKTMTKENVDDKIFWELQFGLTLFITCRSILCLGQLIDNVDIENLLNLNHPFSDINYHHSFNAFKRGGKDLFGKNIFRYIHVRMQNGLIFRFFLKGERNLLFVNRRHPKTC